jgi:hypothetical protein
MYAKIKKKKKPRGGFTHKLEDIPEHIQRGLLYKAAFDGQYVGMHMLNIISEAEKQYKEWYAEKEKEHFKLKNKK